MSSANQLRNGILEKLGVSKNRCDACSNQDCNNDNLFCDHGCLAFSGCDGCSKCVEKFSGGHKCYSNVECKSGRCSNTNLLSFTCDQEWVYQP